MFLPQAVTDAMITCTCRGILRIKFQPWELIQKREREREREAGTIAKYMGRIEHDMVSNTIEVRKRGWSTRIGEKLT